MFRRDKGEREEGECVSHLMPALARFEGLTKVVFAEVEKLGVGERFDAVSRSCTESAQLGEETSEVCAWRREIEDEVVAMVVEACGSVKEVSIRNQSQASVIDDFNEGKRKWIWSRGARKHDL